MRIILLAALCAVMSVSTLAAEQDRLTIYTVNYPLLEHNQRQDHRKDGGFPGSSLGCERADSTAETTRKRALCRIPCPTQ
jgi:hypothetical protein